MKQQSLNAADWINTPSDHKHQLLTAPLYKNHDEYKYTFEHYIVLRFWVFKLMLSSTVGGEATGAEIHQSPKQNPQKITP